MGHQQIPSGEDAKRLPECDLIMKGGITSGLVYPEVVLKLAERYRFAKLGGSSAGAIAAALAAAGEYGRRRGSEPGGFCGLRKACDELKEEGRLVRLFEPAPSARPLFEILLESFAVREASVRRRVLIAARATMRQQPGFTALAALLFVPLVVLCVAAFQGLHWALAVVLALPLAALVAAAVAGLTAGRALRRGMKGLTDFGLCPGTGSEDSLLAWLHKWIQESAGLPLDEPLTFGQLKNAGIELTLMSTDLNLARPVRVPDDLADYRFDDALAQRLPKTIVDGMKGKAGGKGPWPMPTEDLPVLAAVRLSLSFPILFSAVPLLHAPSSEPHLLSDGGIGSNFPIHFFDAWFPTRPTFGVDLADYGGDVVMLANPTVPVPARRRPITGLPQFFAAIADTAQNWRDTTQSELPGFRDRVCHIKIDKGEGGLNLAMPKPVIEALVKRGQKAGDTILATFDEEQWRQHRWVRYLALMEQLQGNLHRVRPSFDEFGPKLADGLPGVTVYREEHDAAWCVQAHAATAELLAVSDTWGPPAGKVNFDSKHGPVPRGEMRIVPRA